MKNNKLIVSMDKHGNMFWRLNGKLHRVGGPAIESVDGSREWFLNNKRHRVDGPAVESASGDKFWYLNDKLHREDGPAIEFFNGGRKWYIKDMDVTEKQFNREVAKMSRGKNEKL